MENASNITKKETVYLERIQFDIDGGTPFQPQEIVSLLYI